MTSNNGHSQICTPNIISAGLPQRGDVILRRESNMFPLIVNGLRGNYKGIPERGMPTLTIEMLENAFNNPKGLIVSNAAFLAGRCRAESPDFSEKMKGYLHKAISAAADKLDAMSLVYVQAAMSLALLGEQETARKELLPLAKGDKGYAAESYLAAFYLAQLGDPSGYPSLLKLLADSNEHYRLMAARHLIGFKPYQGKVVEGKIVDVTGELLKLRKDQSIFVRQDIPHLLTEAEADNLKEILIEISKTDKNKDVRQAALNEIDLMQSK